MSPAFHCVFGVFFCKRELRNHPKRVQNLFTIALTFLGFIYLSNTQADNRSGDKSSPNSPSCPAAFSTNEIKPGMSAALASSESQRASRISLPSQDALPSIFNNPALNQHSAEYSPLQLINKYTLSPQEERAQRKLNNLYGTVLSNLGRGGDYKKNLFKSILRADPKVDTPSLLTQSQTYFKVRTKIQKTDRDILRIVQLNYLEKYRSAGFKNIEVYGGRVLQDWATMTEFLNNLPDADFKLTHDLVSRVHAMGSSSHHKWLQNIGRKILPGIIFAPGELKSEGFNKIWPIKFHKLTAQQLYNIQEAHTYIWRYGIFKTRPGDCEPCKRLVIKEAKTNPDGSLSGSYYNPGSDEFKRLYTDLLEWTNTQMELIDKKSPRALDPVELASVFQYAFVYVHPFVDGNGRVSRALKDKILMKYGLAPDLRLPDINEDLSLSLDEHILMTRIGIRNFLALFEPYKISETQFPSISLIFDSSLSMTDSAEKLKKNPNMGKWLYFSKGESRIALTLTKGGFLIDEHGIAYIYYPRTNTLIPIADKSALIYRNSNSPGDKSKNQVGKEISEIIEATEWLLKQNQNFHETVNVREYSSIKIANDKGEFFLQPEQVKHFLNFLKFKLNPDYVGALFVGGRINDPTQQETKFADFLAGYTGSITFEEIVAHYEIQDFYLYEMEQAIQKDAELKRIAQKPLRDLRTKLHSETRKLVDSFFQVLFEAFDIPYDVEGTSLVSREIRTLTIPLKKEIRSRAQYQAVFAQLRESKLRYKTLDEALQKIDDTQVIVGRVAQPGIEKVGLIQPYRLLNFLNKFPQVKKFFVTLYMKTMPSDRVNSVDNTPSKAAPLKTATDASLNSFLARMMNKSEITQSPAFYNAMNGIRSQLFTSANDYHGFSEEYRRMFSDLALHLADTYSGGFYSTSVSMTALLALNDDRTNFVFAGFSPTRTQKSELYVLRLKKKDLVRFPNYLSSEHELSLRGAVNPLQFNGALVARIESTEVVRQAQIPFHPSDQKTLAYKILTSDPQTVVEALNLGGK